MNRTAAAPTENGGTGSHPTQSGGSSRFARVSAAAVLLAAAIAGCGPGADDVPLQPTPADLQTPVPALESHPPEPVIPTPPPSATMVPSSPTVVPTAAP